MGLADVTAEGVLRSVEEFDRVGRDTFLAEHGFGAARGYFLVVDGSEYDAKAIVGVAHGYNRPDIGPMRSSEFSGGDVTVARRLRQLGFHVQSPPRNPPWSEEELILALALYLRHGQLDDLDPLVVQLSAALNQIPRHAETPDESRFRNPNGVALKLANFAALDPAYPGRGMQRGSRRDAEVWKRFAGDEDALAATAERVLSGLPPSDPYAQQVEVIVSNVESLNTAQFAVAPSSGAEAERREAALVLAYQQHLEAAGHRVVAHLYRVPGTGRLLRCDLFDETRGVLVEAKATPSRSDVRMAIGQLLDYRRFESSPPLMRILLPREPSPDLVALVLACGIGAVWQTRDGFEEVE